MKYTDVIKLIEAHYNSEDSFYSTVDKIIKAELKTGKEISASKIQATFNRCSGIKRNGYTIKPLHNLSELNKPGNNMIEMRQSDITLNDFIAPKETINTINECINEFQHKEELSKYGLEVSNKILLSGPPGVGKTWAAMAIAGELDLNCVFTRWDSVVDSHLGNTGKNIRKVFETAIEKPVILFLDELDATGKERGDNQEVGEMSRVVINLLQNIDMFPTQSFLVAATNHGDLLDSAIWRRFTVINMKIPVEVERKQLIDYYAKNLPITINTDEWVKNTKGMTGAEIKLEIQRKAKKHILNQIKPKLKMA